MPRINSRPIRYVLALLVAAFAVYLRALLAPLLGEQNAYHTVWLAVVVSAWLCGVGPGIVTALVGAVGVWFWILPIPTSTFQHRGQIYGLVGFLLFSAVIIALGESARRAAITQYKLAAIVGSSDDAIISKDLDGIITSWNEGAQRIFGWTSFEAVGRPITTIIPTELLHEEKEIIRRLRAGERVDHFETVRVTKTGNKIAVSITVSPIRDPSGQIIGASKIARDISERVEVETKLKAAHEQLERRVWERTSELHHKNRELQRQAGLVQELSARLLKLQDEERRRIARELHDSIGQMLAVLSMNMADVAKEKEKLSEGAQKCLDENAQLVQEVSQNIRTISHLLHPPLLDEVGLSSALSWFVDGFSQRSKIDVTLDIAENLERLSNDEEISLFRIVQECLTNIHRHSGSSKASIRLAQVDGQVRLEIRDEGKGIPAEKQVDLNSSGDVGVGFRGMRERLRQLGGTLEIHSDASGTVVAAVFPRPNPLDGNATFQSDDFASSSSVN